MGNTNRTYRIRTNVNQDNYVSMQVDHSYNVLEILSLKIDQENAYRYHTSDYGVVVGRALANGGVGVPNAKISVFFSKDTDDANVIRNILYPYTTTRTANADGVRYNLLFDTVDDSCHQNVGTFPNKRLVLDDNNVIEIFDTYYKYTTRTNEAGDYMIFGVPTGTQTIHMDLDLSDCGYLSQRPRDFVYKGYTIEQFENPNQFKESTDLDTLSQIFTQNKTINVRPFWGDTENEDLIGITRADIDINFKFETTCVFMGSVFSDDQSNGINKRCKPSKGMGKMDKLTTSEGTIEMIRKKEDGSVESYTIKGNKLIDGNGTWCYQIPMNLDYMMTDEYGNLVPTDNPDKGIATRARVRFRISMDDESESEKYFKAKVLVPNNPMSSSENMASGNASSSIYSFGTYTPDSCYRDIFWNNVYTVKSYIPRLQHLLGTGTKKFTGIKTVNVSGENNPIPYNNIRIQFPFMFTVMCFLIDSMIKIVGKINNIIAQVQRLLYTIKGIKILGWYPFENIKDLFTSYFSVSDGLCPEMDGYYFVPGADVSDKDYAKALITGTYKQMALDKYPDLINKTGITSSSAITIQTTDVDKDGKTSSGTTTINMPGSINNGDTTSIAYNNADSATSESTICLMRDVDYLMSCVEMNLAEEYNVINFDFYNDWLNGTIYMPRWARTVKVRKIKHGKKATTLKTKIKACTSDSTQGNAQNYMVQTCDGHYASIKSQKLTTKLYGGDAYLKDNKVYREYSYLKVAGKNIGLINTAENKQGLKIYYFRPCEFSGNARVILFATDLVLLGSLNDCDMFGIPQAYKSLGGSSYQMPQDMVSVNIADTENYEEPVGCFKVSEIAAMSLTADTALNKFSSSTITGTSYSAVTWESEGDELLPISEEAGISWNVTGPNQGEKSYKNFYSPGGHFLGLSCFNAETNVKTCTNVSRICEQGVAISQRNESTLSQTSDGVEHEMYFVPTGLISGGDIVDPDFRRAFATMNVNNLATVIDPVTGFYRYSFKNLVPNNFNGEYSTVINSPKYTNNQYNQNIEVTGLVDESTGMSDATRIERADNEDNTYARTIESTSKDYIRFRFGLKDDDNVLRDYKNHFMSNFGLTTGSRASLTLAQTTYFPMYENSYYFYFGLKKGETAMDIFKKNFEASCASNFDSDYAGYLEACSIYYDICSSDNSQIFSNIRIIDAESPYSIQLLDATGENILDYYNMRQYVHPYISGFTCAELDENVDIIKSNKENLVSYARTVQLSLEIASKRLYSYSFDYLSTNDRGDIFSGKSGEVIILWSRDTDTSGNKIMTGKIIDSTNSTIKKLTGYTFSFDSLSLTSQSNTGWTMSLIWNNDLTSFNGDRLSINVPLNEYTLSITSSRGNTMKYGYSLDFYETGSCSVVNFNKSFIDGEQTEIETFRLDREDKYNAAGEPDNVGGYATTTYDIESFISMDKPYDSGYALVIVEGDKYIQYGCELNASVKDDAGNSLEPICSVETANAEAANYSYSRLPLFWISGNTEDTQDIEIRVYYSLSGCPSGYVPILDGRLYKEDKIVRPNIVISHDDYISEDDANSIIFTTSSQYHNYWESLTGETKSISLKEYNIIQTLYDINPDTGNTHTTYLLADTQNAYNIYVCRDGATEKYNGVWEQTTPTAYAIQPSGDVADNDEVFVDNDEFGYNKLLGAVTGASYNSKKDITTINFLGNVPTLSSGNHIVVRCFDADRTVYFFNALTSSTSRKATYPGNVIDKLMDNSYNSEASGLTHVGVYKTIELPKIYYYQPAEVYIVLTNYVLGNTDSVDPHYTLSRTKGFAYEWKPIVVSMDKQYLSISGDTNIDLGRGIMKTDTLLDCLSPIESESGKSHTIVLGEKVLVNASRGNATLYERSTDFSIPFQILRRGVTNDEMLYYDSNEIYDYASFVSADENIFDIVSSAVTNYEPKSITDFSYGNSVMAYCSGMSNDIRYNIAVFSTYGLNPLTYCQYTITATYDIKQNDTYYIFSGTFNGKLAPAVSSGLGLIGKYAIRREPVISPELENPSLDSLFWSGTAKSDQPDWGEDKWVLLKYNGSSAEYDIVPDGTYLDAMDGEGNYYKVQILRG